MGCRFYGVEVAVLVCSYYLIQKYAREYMQAIAVVLLTFAKALLFRVVFIRFYFEFLHFVYFKQETIFAAMCTVNW